MKNNNFKRKKFNIYLAGKVRKYNDWRDKLCKTNLCRLDGKLNSSLMGCEPIENLAIEKEVLISGDNMTGAFAIGDDHGCFHGANSHGLRSIVEEPIIDPHQVLKICKNAIEKSDIIFAWIDEKNCYGTIAEIGYAHALGKYICVAFHTDVIDVDSDDFDLEEELLTIDSSNDMWFVGEMADISFTTNDVVTAFQKMCFKIHIENYE
jgi:hypothetical protein